MNIRRREDQALVELVGRIIYDNLEKMQKELEALLELGLSDVFLKMDELSYLDSSALGMLLSLNKEARAAGTKITMVAPPSHIMGVLTTTYLDQIFPIVVEEEAARITAAF